MYHLTLQQFFFHLSFHFVSQFHSILLRNKIIAECCSLPQRSISSVLHINDSIVFDSWLEINAMLFVDLWFPFLSDFVYLSKNAHYCHSLLLAFRFQPSLNSRLFMPSPIKLLLARASSHQFQITRIPCEREPKEKLKSVEREKERNSTILYQIQIGPFASINIIVSNRFLHSNPLHRPRFASDVWFEKNLYIDRKYIA